MQLFTHSQVRALAFLCGLLAFAANATKADVTVTQRVRRKEPGHEPAWEFVRTIRIKGLKMRIEPDWSSTAPITIFDLEAGKAYGLDPKKKEVIEADLNISGKGRNFVVAPKDLKKTFQATGREEQVADAKCEVYTFDLQGPDPLNKSARIELHDSGTVCISRTIPEGVEYTNFIQEAKKRGMWMAILTMSPCATMLAPYFYGEDPNEMVLSASTRTRWVSSFAVQSKLAGPVEQELTVIEIKSSPIADELFQPPPNWKIRAPIQPR